VVILAVLNGAMFPIGGRLPESWLLSVLTSLAAGILFSEFALLAIGLGLRGMNGRNLAAIAAIGGLWLLTFASTTMLDEATRSNALRHFAGLGAIVVGLSITVLAGSLPIVLIRRIFQLQLEEPAVRLETGGHRTKATNEFVVFAIAMVSALLLGFICSAASDLSREEVLMAYLGTTLLSPLVSLLVCVPATLLILFAPGGGKGLLALLAIVLAVAGVLGLLLLLLLLFVSVLPPTRIGGAPPSASAWSLWAVFFAPVVGGFITLAAPLIAASRDGVRLVRRPHPKSA